MEIPSAIGVPADQPMFGGDVQVAPLHPTRFLRAPRCHPTMPISTFSKRSRVRRARPKRVPTHSVPSIDSWSDSIWASGKPSAFPKATKRFPS